MDHDQFLTKCAQDAAIARVAELHIADRKTYYETLIAEWKAAYRDFATQPWDATFPSFGAKPGPDDAASSTTSSIGAP